MPTNCLQVLTVAGVGVLKDHPISRFTKVSRFPREIQSRQHLNIGCNTMSLSSTMLLRLRLIISSDSRNIERKTS